MEMFAERVSQKPKRIQKGRDRKSHNIATTKRERNRAVSILRQP